MAMGNRASEQQSALFVPSGKLARSPGHPFYERVNSLLAGESFDSFVEERCAKFYADKMGRPGLPPGVYFRLLMVGYFEGSSSEREIAWRCADSLSLRGFLGYALEQATTNHSTLSATRRLIDLETHREVFGWILSLLGRRGLLKGRTVAVDSTTLEANAAMRSIVRKDGGQSYDGFLDDLAKASGIETPTREDRAKVDKKRKKKGSNDDWTHPRDPDARIAKMKDGRTHLAHKVEHATDLDTTAIVSVTVQAADLGDTHTVYETLSEASDHLSQALPDGNGITDVVLDKG
ncbi:MAG: transposase [Pseudohongiellaceae bacterium]|jgi:transposase